MPLEFFRSSSEQLLLEAVSGAFAKDRAQYEPESRQARAAAQATIAGQGLVQPITLPGKGHPGISLVEATSIIEAAGGQQVSFPLTESLLLASALAGSGREIDADISDASATARIVLSAGCAPGQSWSIDIGSPYEEAASARITAPKGDEQIIADLDLRPIVWVLMAADILGASQSVFDKSMTYLGERQQFGQPLSSYQALRHRAADDWVLLEDMRSSIDHAAALFDQGADTVEVLKAARIAKATASEAGPVVAENAIQYHGAVGFTWEFGLHFALKRIKRLSLTQGTASDHYRLVGAQYLDGIAATTLTSGA